MSNGIVGYGAYVPRLRLAKQAIAEAHAWMSAPKKPVRGSRAFCNWDEDALTMAVEATRDCLLGMDVPSITALSVDALDFVSSTAPYRGVQHAAIVAAALDSMRRITLVDSSGSGRSGVARLAEAMERPRGSAIVVASDRPVARPGSPQELTFGAGAAAFAIGGENVLAQIVGRASTMALMFDTFRPADSDFDYQWEERWIRDEGFAKLVPEAVNLALADAGLAISDVQHLILASALPRMTDEIAHRLRFEGTVARQLDEIGQAGVAQPLLMLADVLDRAKAGERIVLIGFGQGVEAIVLETTSFIEKVQRPRLAPQMENGLLVETYLRMAAHYGLIEPHFGMRAERIVKPALTEQYRSSYQLAAFNAGACGACGTVQFPQLAYCVNPQCNAPAAGFTQHRLADERSRVMTFTADWLTYHPAPPLNIGMAQFDSGARLIMEMVDVAPGELEVGLAMRPVFRIKERDTDRGFNRYFWKLAPKI